MGVRDGNIEDVSERTFRRVRSRAAADARDAGRAFRAPRSVSSSSRARRHEESCSKFSPFLPWAHRSSGTPTHTAALWQGVCVFLLGRSMPCLKCASLLRLQARTMQTLSPPRNNICVCVAATRGCRGKACQGSTRPHCRPLASTDMCCTRKRSTVRAVRPSIPMNRCMGRTRQRELTALHLLTPSGRCLERGELRSLERVE